jgi:nucleotide sugar dehydrogenase
MMAMNQPPRAASHVTIPEVIAIWGGGLIGLSTAAHYARKGIKSVIYDISEVQVANINASRFPPNYEEWIGFSAKQYVANSVIRATSDQSDLGRASIKIHFIAVPTESKGEPYMGAVESVLESIASMSPDLIIIESTVVPGSTISLSRKHRLPLGIATRRDWFTTSDNNLENCVRVYSGITNDVSERIQAVLSIVCKRLVRATSCTVVELTKSLDNGMFHTTAMYASQVAAAYADSNVAEALELTATHWRLGNHVYFPSLGTGGPCIPIANKYLLAGASDPEQLTLATDAISYDASNPQEVAARIRGQLKTGDRVAILGICYRGDIKAHSESPHVKFALELVRLGTSIGVHDPYYSNEELNDITGGTSFRFPQDLKDFQFVYVGPNHNLYSKDVQSTLTHMRRGQSILDNQGIWEASADFARARGISYWRVGGARWLPPSSTTTLVQPVNANMVSDEIPVVFKTKFFEIRAIPNKKDPISDPWYILDRPDSVIVIPVTSSGRLLLQKQHRPQINQSAWEFPGGAIDPEESPQQAAIRELDEETGLRSASIQTLGSYYPIPGLSTQKTYVFLAHISEDQISKPSFSAVEEGISSFRVVDVQTCRSLISTSEIVDGFTLSAFAYWQSVTPSANYA